MLMKTPVDGARISSGFGSRFHPILGYTRMHKGVDFAVPTGTPVMAAGAGTIQFMGRASGYGNFVKINHGNGYATAYGHLSRFAPGMRAGARVRQGQVFAYSGMTGMATGPHLHYEILVNNVPGQSADREDGAGPPADRASCCASSRRSGWRSTIWSPAPRWKPRWRTTPPICARRKAK